MKDNLKKNNLSKNGKGKNISISKDVILEGEVIIGNNVVIEPYCIIKNSKILSNTHIKSYTHIDQSKIGSNCKIGPYANIRPGSIIENNVEIGNFVEIKKSKIGSFSRINHMTFVGDAIVAKNVTLGAGTITCNHDGKKINKIKINEGAYIGSGTKLIAPLRIGKKSIIGAGSVITNNVPANKLTLSRSQQITINRRKKKI